MSKRLPIVLGDSADLQRLQPSDKLPADATGLASQEEFEELETHFRSLCRWMLNEGFELPAELVKESDLL